MSLEIQWFIYALVSNEIVSLEQCQEIYDTLGEPDLELYAQTLLDAMAEAMTQEEAESLLSQIQTVLDYAVEQGATGEVPEIFAAQSVDAAADEEPEEEPKVQIQLANLPKFENIMQKSDAELRDFVINLLESLRIYGASDLHMSAMAMPFVRRNLQLERISTQPLSPEEAMRLNTILLTPDEKAQFEEKQDFGLALEIGKDRFRVALMMHKDGYAGSYRIVPDHICSLSELGFLPANIATLERMLDYSNGLVLVTGPIGGGKTTTLGAMINIINERREDHIITVEDPIEILQPSKNCQVTQRQVGQHTASYHSALKGALREDPDVIVIGEMHDLETIENAITASETGHLVIGTLHTSDAGSTLNRILDVFPPAQQPQIRAMVAGSLRGIVCQKLIPGLDGKLTLGYEIMTNAVSISNLISEGKTHQLKAAMQIGSKSGMCTMDQCLLDKYKANLISYEVALSYMTDASIIQQTKQHFGMLEAQKIVAANEKVKQDNEKGKVK